MDRQEDHGGGAVYVLTIKFKGLESQEIRFRRKPEIQGINENGYSWILVDGLTYVGFIVEAETWELRPCEGWG